MKRKFLLIVLLIVTFTFTALPTVAQDSESIVDFTWSHNSKYLAITKDYSKVQIYDVNQQSIVNEILPNADLVGDVNWNSTDDKLSITTDINSIEIWNLDDITSTKTLTIDSVTGLNSFWSLDDHYLVLIGDGEGTENFFVWNLETQQVIYQSTISPTLDAEWSHDGGYLAISAPAPHIDLFNIEQLQIEAYVGLTLIEIRTIYNNGQKGDEKTAFVIIGSVAWSPDDQFIIAGAAYGEVTVWKVATNEVIYQMWSNNLDHADPANSQLFRVIDVWFSPDGSTFQSVATDGTYRIWDASNGDLVFETHLIVNTPIHIGYTSPDRTMFAYLDYENELHIVAINDLIMEQIHRKIDECSPSEALATTLNAYLDNSDSSGFVGELAMLDENALSPECVAQLTAMANLLVENQTD